MLALLVLPYLVCLGFLFWKSNRDKKNETTKNDSSQQHDDDILDNDI